MLEFAAAAMILRPVTVEPVNATLSTSICAASAAPPTGPSDGTVFTTPGGNLLSRQHPHGGMDDRSHPASFTNSDNFCATLVR
jgi:hypothetical protein